MKNIFFAAAISGICLFGISCNNSDDPAPANNNAFAGNWTVVLLDNAPLTGGQTGSYVTTATSATAGTGHFDFYDGTAHNIEDAGYVLSGGNYQVSFVKTGGNWDLTSGAGGSWTIDTLTSSVLRMTNSTGLIIRCVK